MVLLDYSDQALDRAEPGEVIAGIARHVRRIRPDVVVTFGPDGAYGHPDHMAISQFTTAAIVAAAEPASAGADPAPRPAGGPAHSVSKLYYLAWPAAAWAAFEAAFRRLVSTVDGRERQATPWPEWAITTVIDTRAFWSTVWRAISCHDSQVSAYERLRDLTPSTTRRCGAGSRSIACSARSTADASARPTSSRGFPDERVRNSR